MNIRSFRTVLYLAKFLTTTQPRRRRLQKLAETDPEQAFDQASDCLRGLCQHLLEIAGTDLTVKGLENIPDEPVLFVGNHCSYFDIVVTMASLPRGSGFVAKESLAKIPGFKGWMDLIHCLYLDRSDLKKGVQMIRDGIDIIKSGYSMMVYPEGTRSKTGQLGDLKGGALKMAQRSGAPIVLVACTGSRDIYENNSRLNIKPAKVQLTFGKPFRIDELPKEERRFAARYTKEQLQLLLDDQKTLKK